MGYFKVHIDTWIFHLSELTRFTQKCNHSLKAQALDVDFNDGTLMKIWDQEVRKNSQKLIFVNKKQVYRQILNIVKIPFRFSRHTTISVRRSCSEGQKWHVSPKKWSQSQKKRNFALISKVVFQSNVRSESASKSLKTVKISSMSVLSNIYESFFLL